MVESSKSLRLNTKQSTHLLRLGLDHNNDKIDRTTARADLLLDTLASKIPVDPALLDLLPAVIRALSEQLQAVSGLPLGNLLLDPQTKMATIRKIKDFAKDLGTTARDQIERDVALAVYFAAIASALVHHDAKISQHTYNKLEQSFDKLSTENWVSPGLSRLFKKARRHCAKRT